MQGSNLFDKVKEVVKSYDKNARIILYGSRARGDFSDESDWDFLILLKKDVDEKLKDNIRDDLFYIELNTDTVISSIIHSKAKWERLKITPFYQNIQREGKLV